MQALGILAFVVALLLSIMVHEFGHFITAKRFGMKVSEFFLGFGQKIWSITRGETEFGIKAIPAGGYCRIEGMSPKDEMAVGEPFTKPVALANLSFSGRAPSYISFLGSSYFWRSLWALEPRK